MFTRQELESAAEVVYQQMPPTPQYNWPLISEHVGAPVWVKHENQTPTGAFKIRGSITFMDWLIRTHPEVKGIATATRGNHGQGQAQAAVAAGLEAKIVVPKGNSVEKNSAMRAFGGELIEYGDDFDEAKLEALRISEQLGYFFVPPFHPELVRGVATYSLELFTAVPDLDTVYVPIGCGSGVCGVIAARDALGLETKVVGVVSNQANAVKRSFESGTPTNTESANTFADGVAVRVIVPDAFDIYSKGADRVVEVSDDEVAEAMRIYFRMTHNVAEGAGAAPLAALIQERAKMQGKKAAVILCGGNVDTDKFAAVLRGETPLP